MSDQTKNFIAYMVSLSLLILGFSLFKTWQPPVPMVRAGAPRHAQSLSAGRALASLHVLKPPELEAALKL